MRLDQFLVEKGLVATREKAQALIMAGLVLVDRRPVTKAGQRIRQDQRVELLEPPRYVSRGGYKLEHAIRRFGLNLEGKVALDVGSSTGGFTQCLLMHGVKRVYAVDVGRGQMDYNLRQDSRVILLEETDARELTEKHIPEFVDLLTVDVSFISLRKVIPNLLRFLKEDGLLLPLVKPQFEVGPDRVRKGVVKDPSDRKRAVMDVVFFLKEHGLKVGNVVKARPRGTKGNEEFFLLAGWLLHEQEDIQRMVEDAITEAV